MWRFSILLLVALASLGCRDSGVPPATGDDAPRIASMSPAISIMLHDLGLADRIVGRHGSDNWVDASVPVVGDQSGLDYETLARAKPTHVLMQESAGGTPALLEELANERGWTVLTLPLLQLDEISGAVEALASAFSEQPGVPDRADALLARMRSAWAARPDLAAGAGRTLCVYWVSPISVAGPGSFHHDLLLRMGIDALPESGGAYITLDREDLKRLNPDSILILSPDVSEDELAGAIASWRSLGVVAVEEGRVAVLNDWRFLTPSTAMIDFADRIAAVINGWPQRDDAEKKPRPDNPEQSENPAAHET